MRWWPVVLLLGATGLAPLHAQEPRLAARLPAGAAMEVQRLVDSATRSGLPSDPLIQKALEGESKGADSAGIVRAVQALLDRLRTARGSLGAASSEPELIAAAAALRAGASPASLADLRALRPGQPLMVPLSVLADLMAAGISRDRAWNSIREMAATGAADAAFFTLRDRLTDATPPTDRRPPDAQRPPAETPPAARPINP